MTFLAWEKDSCVVTTDPTRIDVSAALGLLHTTHWGAHLTRATLQKAMQHSIPFAVLSGEDMLGFARVVSERASQPPMSHDQFADSGSHVREWRSQGNHRKS